MKQKFLWLAVSGLMLLSMGIAACAPAVAEQEVEEEEKEEAEEEIQILSVGETYQKSEVAVTVSEAILTDSYEYYDEASKSMLSKEASPGTSFLIIAVEIKNVGSRVRLREGRDRIRVYDSEDSQHRFKAYYGQDRLLTPYSLPTGGEIEGKILFNIPEGTSGLRIEYWEPEPVRKFAEWVVE